LTPLLVTPLASVTDFIVDPIVDAATEFIDSVGLIGVFILMLLESACIPVPSEAIMLFAGFNVSEGDLTMFGIIAAGVLGNVVGSWIAWAAGYYGRVELLEKNRLVHINPKHLAWADSWFQRHGDATVFFSRMLPIIRTFISLPAGIAKMPFWRFTWLTALGCIPWVTLLAFIGREVGDNWEEWRDYLHYFDYPVAAAILAGIVYFLIKRRGSGPPPATTADAEA
jgi:membrane protein DedA with SNARE-associated domain